MIRVLHVLGGLNAGGMESMIMNYYRNIDRTKIQFDFLVFSKKSFYDDEVEKLGGRIYRITPRRNNFIKNNIELDIFFKNHKEYKIVQIHQGINYFLPLIKAKKYKVPHRIVHSHGMAPKLIKRQGILFDIYTVPKISRLGTDFIACSKDAASQLFSSEIVENNMYKILNNAIDLQMYRSNSNIKNYVKKKLNIENKLVIGHVGNFTKVKNHKFLIDIYYEIFKKNRNSVLLLIGEGSEKDIIKEKVRKLNLIDNVMFLGNRKDVNEILCAMDYFVFPSLYEGLPVSVIEAQACGVKCLISDIITREVKVTENLRYISLNNDAKTWAKSIIDFNKCDESNIYDQLSLAGYNIKNEAMKIEDYYKKLLKIKGGI